MEATSSEKAGGTVFRSPFVLAHGAPCGASSGITRGVVTSSRIDLTVQGAGGCLVPRETLRPSGPN